MLAAFASHTDADHPLDALVVGEFPDPVEREGWTTVTVRAASINHHDLWALRGTALSPDRCPMVLGTDAAGVTPDGQEVVVHGVVGNPDPGRGDETLDPGRTMLSELHQGTLAQYVSVPTRNLIPKPADLSFEAASCLPTAWLTAYRMLFNRGRVTPGQTVLIQGAAGGVATAATALARAAGARVWVTSRDEAKRAYALENGAHAVFESGARLPERVDTVIESVGQATWDHSLKSVRPGGIIVVSGATSGAAAMTDLRRIFFLQVSVVGSTMGTISEFGDLLTFLDNTGLRPKVAQTFPLSEAREALALMESGDVFGKLVLVP